MAIYCIAGNTESEIGTLAINFCKQKHSSAIPLVN